MITDIAKNIIWYNYKGDEIAWDGRQYISLLSEGCFDTLDEMDKFWKDFFEGK